VFTKFVLLFVFLDSTAWFKMFPQPVQMFTVIN
jgi:hypothetical protein